MMRNSASPCLPSTSPSPRRCGGGGFPAITIMPDVSATTWRMQGGRSARMNTTRTAREWRRPPNPPRTKRRWSNFNERTSPNSTRKSWNDENARGEISGWPYLPVSLPTKGELAELRADQAECKRLDLHCPKCKGPLDDGHHSGHVTAGGPMLARRVSAPLHYHRTPGGRQVKSADDDLLIDWILDGQAAACPLVAEIVSLGRRLCSLRRKAHRR